MNKKNKIVRCKNSILSSVNNQNIILDINTGKFIKINQTGKDIFQLTSKKISYSALLLKLSKMYDADESSIENDVKIFLNACIKEKLLSISE